jgi:hypothetical protein
MRPVAAKETSNEAHVDVKHDVPVNATDTDVSGGSHTDYTPQAGDVVEFEYCGEVCSGVVGRLYGAGDLVVCRRYCEEWTTVHAFLLTDGTYENPRVVGHIEIDGDITNYLAKAYFAKTPQVTPQVKVGDLVEAAEGNRRGWASVGQVLRIVKIDSDHC